MKKGIKEYKELLKYAREETADESRRAEKLRAHLFDVSAKLDTALDRLEMISNGQYYPTECQGIINHQDRASKTAAVALKKICRMRERQP